MRQTSLNLTLCPTLDALLFKVLKQQLRVFKNPVLVRYFYTPQDILIPVCLAGKDLQKIEVWLLLR